MSIKLFIALHCILSILKIPMMSHYYIIIWCFQGFFAVPGCTLLSHFRAVHSIVTRSKGFICTRYGILSFENEIMDACVVIGPTI